MRFLYLLLCGFLLTSCSRFSNPEAAAINAQLGVGYLYLHEVSLAKEKLLLALAENSCDPVANDAFGYLLEQTGSVRQAENYYLTAIKCASSKGAAWNNYGTYLYRQQRYREALRYFLLAAHDIKYLNIANSYHNAGLCAAKLRLSTLAIQYFKAGGVN